MTGLLQNRAAPRDCHLPIDRPLCQSHAFAPWFGGTTRPTVDPLHDRRRDLDAETWRRRCTLTRNAVAWSHFHGARGVQCSAHQHARRPVGLFLLVVALDQVRQPQRQTPVPFPPVGVCRVGTPTVLVRIMILPQLLECVRNLRPRGRFGTITRGSDDIGDPPISRDRHMPCLSRGPDDKSNDDIPARRGERPAATTRMTTTALLFPQWCQPSGAMTQPGQEPESRAGRTSRDDSPGGRSNGARARQAGEHVRVGVGVQLFGDLVGQHVDLLDERAQRCQQRPGHMCSRDAGVAGRSPGRGFVLVDETSEDRSTPDPAVNRLGTGDAGRGGCSCSARCGRCQRRGRVL